MKKIIFGLMIVFVTTIMTSTDMFATLNCIQGAACAVGGNTCGGGSCIGGTAPVSQGACTGPSRTYSLPFDAVLCNERGLQGGDTSPYGPNNEGGSIYCGGTATVSCDQASSQANCESDYMNTLIDLNRQLQDPNVCTRDPNATSAGGSNGSCFCSEYTVPPACGSANQTVVSSVPTGTQLCSGGVASTVVINDRIYNWTCTASGSNIFSLGNSVECSAINRITTTTTATNSCVPFFGVFPSSPGIGQLSTAVSKNSTGIVEVVSGANIFKMYIHNNDTNSNRSGQFVPYSDSNRNIYGCNANNRSYPISTVAPLMRGMPRGLTVSCEVCTTTNSSSRQVACNPLPAHAIANTATNITQTLIGSTRTPSTNYSYNTTPATGECRFVCTSGYTWSGTANACLADTRSVSCGTLPTHTLANTILSLTQTRNGSTRTPLTGYTYNTTPSITQCRYQCESGYTRDGYICVGNSNPIGGTCDACTTSAECPVDHTCLGQVGNKVCQHTSNCGPLGCHACAQ